ncbi:AAA family ATPase [Lederbergia wuyishanensis]|uniref:histidine kinase n=1 Tax=Lederbergia wuyishanensis TaxID=1347903 RepID=A0ABU0D6W8_9BACI|nr:ATP-binding sensor histidine kinase [Lederbergia wuyishanensis]MCJ8008840.1 trifunctional serine/threonine-protein kinase/ATP-binding protein/sensor histidine kinase [Lederbergia wuyishanensis]MDQ0344162.1 putative ATPase/signal transduction histidine kinase [Lederbergia wuyishanensis]
MNVTADLQTNLPGYEGIIELETNQIYTYFTAVDQTSKISVLIKKLVKEDLNPQEFATVKHEYNMTKDLNVKGILKPIRLESYWNKLYFIAESFQGVSLSSYMKRNLIDIKQFLHIAIKLTTIIEDLHLCHIIHKNIQPENILVRERASEIKMTGFYHAALLKRESHRAHVNPYTLGKQLHYISPEQTGRINRYLDSRTDLYSLGVVFYELLTGRLPFEMDDPIELVHAHIAKRPTPPDEIDPSIPHILSNIIMKLLSKMPESRYQSATGLKLDLIKFEKQLDFSLAENDSSPFFNIEDKLYGRNEELSKFITAFDHVCKGNCSFVLIPGVSGIGKTALVHEVQKPLVRNKGYFISGKFDQLKRDAPYHPLIQALQDLLKQVMAEGEKSIHRWKIGLETEVGPYLAAIAKMVPAIKWIVGDIEEPDELPAIESHTRLRFAFLRLINLFSSEHHPLVIFLDDLQWADHETLDLLQYILSQQKVQSLFVIGAYRDNEVDVTHPFHLMVKELQSIKGLVTSIQLHPLSLEDIKEWAVDALYCEEKESEEIAVFIEKITKGNPFFIKQLFQSFYDQQLIFFNEEQGKWTSNLQLLTKITVQEDIISLIVERFNKLPAETQKLLKLASCIGNEFEINVLSTVYEKSTIITVQTLWESLREGMILPLSPSYKWIYEDDEINLAETQVLRYKFLHDRIQQAVYSTMTKMEREKYHLTIGRLLVLYYKSKNNIDDKVFEIINHLNQCQNYLNNSEKLQLAEWNCIAGEKAKQSAAFRSSLSFYKVGKDLLGDEGWKFHNKLTSRMTIGLGEAEYLDNQFDSAENRFDEALSKVQTKQEKLRIYQLKMALYTHLHRVDEAIGCGIKGLQLFGWNLNKRPGKLAVAIEFLRAKIALSKRKAKDLRELPNMDDADKRLILQTFINMNASSYHVDQNLAALLMLKAFNFIIKHGTADVSPLVFNNYALILSSGFHQYNESYEFGRLALYEAENSRNSHLLGRVYFVYGSFVNHWKNHIVYSQQYLEHSQKHCIESGNAHLAGACSSFICMISFLKGHQLEETVRTIDEQLNFSNQIQYDLSRNFLNEMKYWIHVLNESIKEPNWRFPVITDDTSAEIIHYTVRLQLAYLLNEQDIAKELLEKLRVLVNGTLTLVIAPEYYFYIDLWMTKMYENATMYEKRGYQKQIKKHLALWKKWSRHSPSNYEHKYLLVKAEEAKLKSDFVNASKYYDKAIMMAQKNGFIQDTAIANECAGRYYLSQDMPFVAKAYLNAAILAYENWGATRKARLIKDEYQNLLKEETLAVIGKNETVSLDLATMMKAAQALSGEIVLEKLLTRLMNIVLENSGAEKIIMFLKVEDQLIPVAHGDHEKIEAFIEKDTMEYPLNMIHYVEKSLEPVVVSGGAIYGMFKNDPYIKKYQPKSVLCFPILHQGKLIGAMFLENNMMTHAFTKERIEILNILSTQAAISLENAFLYRNLEGKVKERTAQLEFAYKDLEKANFDLAQSEEMRRKFLSNISHDLRSPITSVQGYIEAILEGVISKDEDKELYLERSHQRLLTLNRMIEDLFELTKLESRGMSMHMEYIPSNQLVEHLWKLFEHDIVNANLAFSVRIDPSIDGVYPLIEVDIRRMEQVLQNLISNALKNTIVGGITLKHKVDLEKKEAVFILADSGKGISDDDLPHIFERFYTKSIERNDGHGLGLSICKEIIHYHRGEISVESMVGRGTSFTIRLPIFEIEDEVL